MKFGHIVTVGTSLITNTGGETTLGCQGRKAALDGLESACSDLDKNVSGAGIEEKRKQAKKYLLKLNPAQEFAYRPAQSNKPKDRLPQELSYLWKFANGGYNQRQCSQQDIVRFISSDTNDAKNCSLIICDTLQDQPWKKWYAATFNVDNDFAAEVNAEKGDLFRTTGIQKWMEKIQKMVEELKTAGCDRIFLNVTGGYKGTVPYSTLMGMVHGPNMMIGYLFEESSEIIFMPAYPVGLDFRQWHENALRLWMAQRPSGTDYFIPDLPVRELLQSDQNLSSFGRTLEYQYETQLKTDPLKTYSKNIITRLLHESGPWVGGEKPEKAGNTQQQWDSDKAKNLREILYDLIDKVGDIIWLGDKIPEMVEHAQRHHHNLLEFTELFLTPILYHQPDFLNAQERFVLLSAVMLHDSGHSLDRLSVQACKDLAVFFGHISVEGLGQEIPLFPNDVRDYHQYLAAIRLNDKDMAADLGWPRHEGLKNKGLAKSLHEAVILVCLYHRRRMDYNEDTGKQKGKLHLTGQWPGPLYSRANQFNGKCGVDIMKVVALFRLIDGCDSQARRAGPQERIKLTLSLLERDYQTAAMRAEQAYEAFQGGPGCANKDRWIRSIIAGSAGSAWILNDNQRLTRMECLKILHDCKISEEDKQCARLWLMAAEAADRAQMRFGQFPHFMKHRAVTEIDVLPADNFGPNNFAFNIILVPDSGTELIQDPHNTSHYGTVKGFWLYQCLFKDDNNQDVTLAKTIEEEVSSEYHQVAEYAVKKLGLKATYWWDNQWEVRINGGKPFYLVTA
ncbi:hypothetical protein M1N79_01535 [Dehalococcoidia bacterium]|nr:hypothetical protein [Dehalococcoidia bacterium]